MSGYIPTLKENTVSSKSSYTPTLKGAIPIKMPDVREEFNDIKKKQILKNYIPKTPTAETSSAYKPTIKTDVAPVNIFDKKRNFTPLFPHQPLTASIEPSLTHIAKASIKNSAFINA